MAISAGTVVADAKMNMRGFMRDLSVMKKSGTKAADRIGKKYRALGGRMQSIGRSMTMSLTAPLAAMGAASVKAFSTFDSEMTKSTAIMSNVSKEMRGTMEQAAMSVSEDLNMASSKAAESFFFLASAGLDAKQSVAALPQVAEFAKAGMFDMATATDLATDAQSALGLTVDDAAQNMKNMKRVTDTLVKANTLANASVQQFSEALTNRAAAALKSANKEMEEGVAVLAAFADQGIKGRYAGEQLARILRILSQAANDNKEEFEQMGIIDAQGNLNSMSQIVKALSSEMKGLSDTQKSAKLEQLGFTARVQASIKPLLGLSGEIANYEKQLKNAAGTTKEVADKQMKGFSEQLGVTWQMIRNAGIEIGNMLAPAIGELNTLVRASVSAWRGLSDTTKGVVLSIGSIVAAVGPLIAATGTLIKLIPALTAGFKALQGTLMANPIYAIGTAIAFVGAKAVIARQEMNQLKASIDSVLKSETATLDEVNNKIAELGEKYKEAANVAKTVPGLKTEDIVEEGLPERLNELIKLQRKLSQQDLIKRGAEQRVERLKLMFALMGDSMKNLSNTTSTMDIARPFVEAKQPVHDIVQGLGLAEQKVKQLTDQDLTAMWKEGVDIGEKIAPPGSMAAAQERLKKLREQLRFATDPDVINRLQTQIRGLEGDLGRSSGAAQQLGQSIGQAFSQAALHGKNLMGVVKNLVKQLASRVFVQGITALITGGSSLVAGSIGSAIFSGMFHSGGMVPGSGERMIRAKGGEMVLTQSQQRALGGMMGGGQGATISERSMQNAFEKALSKTVTEAAPSRIFELSQQGRRSY